MPPSSPSLASFHPSRLGPVLPQRRLTAFEGPVLGSSPSGSVAPTSTSPSQAQGFRQGHILQDHIRHSHFSLSSLTSLQPDGLSLLFQHTLPLPRHRRLPAASSSRHFSASVQLTAEAFGCWLPPSPPARA
ncbi:hypothetical protein NL676_012287 [Syzygium grande]|nr:hypothetical protein NL676_012287 [Syzygium grande]